MHHIDRAAPWDEVWQAMETLVEQGKVVYVGSSNFAGWHIAQANEAAARRHFLGLVSEQSLYNLMARTVELEVLPACRAYGLGVIPWSPLAGGLLGGASDRRHRPAQERAAALRAGAAAARAVGSVLHASWARSRPPSRSRGCCTRRASPRRSSGRARSSSSKARRCARPRSSSTTQR